MLVLLLTFFAVSQPLVGQTDALTEIPIGSSLHADSHGGPTSWLSRSGRFAFGFYPEDLGFAIGITMYVSHEKSLVIWKAVEEEKGGIKTFSKNAVLTFYPEGFLLMPNNIALFKFNNTGGSTSAVMLDSGNFIVFDANYSDRTNCSTAFSPNRSDVHANSCIAWQSFDYPTDTMMGGQVLNCGKDLISRQSSVDNSFYKLSMQCDNNLVIYAVTMNISSNGTKTPESKPLWASLTYGKLYTKLVLGQGGRLYLSTPEGISQYNLSQYNNPNDDEANMIYYAALAPNRYFRMFELNLISNKTNVIYEIPTLNDDCHNQYRCGLNSYCVVINNRAGCRCLPGFNFMNDKSKGCQRISIPQPKCSDTNAFSMDSLENLMWFDEAYSTVPADSKEDCNRTCFVECHCEAAVFFNGICAKHKLPMTHATRGTNFTTGVSIAYIKMYTGSSDRNDEGKGRLIKYLVAVVLCAAINAGVFLALLALGAGSYWMFYGRYRLLWRKWALAFQEEVAPRSFSFEELVKATNSFFLELGTGGHGTVFKGFIKMYGRENPVPVAVKRLSNEEREGENDFQAEIRIIGRAHHVNLIRLLGFCHEKPKLLLVYEYMSRGSLANLICDHSSTLISWKLRVDILLGVAKGIHYLHRECETKIIHRDIKPENILIAGNWKPKISDFGISKFSLGGFQPPTSTKRTSAPGTAGYVAPECVQSKGQNVTEKADVYSFGIVVLETVFLQRNAVDNNLLDLALKFCDDIEKERREQVKVAEGELDQKERMVKLAMLCVEENPEVRPDMEEVILSIQKGVLPVPSAAAVVTTQTMASGKKLSWAPLPK